MTTQFVPAVPVDAVPVDTVSGDVATGNTVSGDVAAGNTVPGDGAGSARVGSTRSAGRAYERKRRREGRVPNRRVTATGSPIAAALTRVPFVMLIIFLLAGAIVGVLWLNTMTDEAGLRASQSRRAQIELKIKIEAGQRNAAALNATPRIAEAARGLGLVQAGDAAVLKVNPDGSATVIGTPAPALTPGAGAPAPTQQASNAPAASTPAASTPGSPPPSTASAKTASAKTASAQTVPAKTVRANTVPAKAVPAKAVPAKTVPAKPAPAKTPAVKTEPGKHVPVRTAPAGTGPATTAPVKPPIPGGTPSGPGGTVPTSTTGAGQ